jgi:hypothetical protein
VSELEAIYGDAERANPKTDWTKRANAVLRLADETDLPFVGPEAGEESFVGPEAGSENGAAPVTHPWQPRSIAKAADETPCRPDKFSGTIYSDSTTLASGEPGIGKSMFLTAATASEAIEGGTPLYLDFEGTPATLAERLLAAGLSEEQLERVLYLRPTVQATPDEIRAMVAHLRPTLIAVDSYDAALAAFSLESKNEDIRTFDTLVMGPLRSTGAAIIVADHVVKNREQRGPYSIGGQAKLALADAHLGLSVITPLRRGGRGKLKVKTHKDRHGWLPRTAVFELNSHPETGALSWAVTVEQDADDDTDFRPTVLMERASRYLEIQTEPVSQRQVERDVTGNGAALRTAIAVLIREGYVTPSDGPRHATLLASAKAFREGEE